MILEDSLPRDALVQMPARLKVEGGRLALARLAAGETKVLSYKVNFLMRGYFQIGPLLVETGDVFGLHRRFRILTEPALRAGIAESSAAGGLQSGLAPPDGGNPPDPSPV